MHKLEYLGTCRPRMRVICKLATEFITLTIACLHHFSVSCIILCQYYNMTQTGLGDELNNATTENLYLALSHVYTSDNLLVLAQELSPVINYLTLFSNLKQRGKFDKTIWLQTLADAHDVPSLVQDYNGIIVIIPELQANLKLFSKLWAQLRRHTKVSVIVKDLSRSFYYEMCSTVFGGASFAKTAELDLNQSVLRVAANCRLFNWQTFPICIQDFVFTLDMPDGGLLLYFNNPLDQVSQLSSSVVKIMKHTTAGGEIMKLKNAFAKGDHASLLLNVLLNDKVPDFLDQQFSPVEQAFYLDKLRGNTDVVVLERNLDYFPLLLSHLNYLGLLDDVFGTLDEFNTVLTSGEKLNDELYAKLKDLNFASIGVKLNKLARYIQLEYENSDKLTDLQEIKQLVSNLGSLTTKQELVRKHTALSEAILDIIKNNKSGEEKYNMREQWLEVQNDLFELDYKQQLTRVQHLESQNCALQTLLSLVVLISLTNDGIRQRDIDSIEEDVFKNYGLTAVLALRKLQDYRLIKVNAKGNDFFGTFTFGKAEIETTITSTATTTAATLAPVSYEDSLTLGITGGQDVYKSTYTLISKFWNLHPVDEDEGVVIESIQDYPHPSFTLPAATVPLIGRIIESLYFRDFLKYKPVTSVSKRPNWDNLNLDTMFKGQTIDRNLCDELDARNSQEDTREQYVMVVLLGGITRSEISVLRYLQGRLEKRNKRLIVITSGLVSNRTLLKVVEE